MRVYLVGLIMVFALVGCVTDKPYAVGKVVYTGARTAYIEFELPADAKLQTMDKVLVTYDKVRTAVKDEIVQQNKKKENVNGSQIQK